MRKESCVWAISRVQRPRRPTPTVRERQRSPPLGKTAKSPGSSHHPPADMGLSLRRSLFLVLLVAALLDGSQGIYCFQCTSLHDPECEIVMPNDTTSSYYRPCEPPPEAYGREMFCRKIEQIIHDRDELVRVIRKCGWVMHEKRDCYSVSNHGHTETVCQCFTDGCNSATSSLPSYFLFSAVSLIYLFYDRFV